MFDQEHTKNVCSVQALEDCSFLLCSGLIFLISSHFQCFVDERQSEFEKFDQIQAMVDQILQQWDRAQGLLLDSRYVEETLPGSDESITEKRVNMTFCFIELDLTS